MNRRRLLIALAAAALPASRAWAGELTGSPASMEEQHAVAVRSDYSFLRRPADVLHMAEIGRLVHVESGGDFVLSKVSFPYARPEVLSFIEHFAAEYRDVAGSRLVVTSLTRPESLQPRNAHDLSVHPAGMAVDLRVPADATVRRWFERRLLELEDLGAIDVTREKNPPHYHVAVFGARYLPIAARLDSIARDREFRAQAQLARLTMAGLEANAPDGDWSRAWIFWVAVPALLVGAQRANRIHLRGAPRREVARAGRDEQE